MSPLPHDTVELLLPWFVAGTLPEPERSAVEEHLRGCEVCRREEAWLRGVADAVRSRPVPSPAPELGARVLARLAARQASGPWWRRVWAVREARALLAVAVAEAVALAALVVSWAPQPPAFRTLGGPTAAHVQVVFRPDATEAGIRAALLRVGATVVEGPGATGVYRLRLPPGSDPRIVAERLRNDALVRFAEPEP
ncbi:MAG: zf-HC2 domain-containing protein [Firmicutes bacterium]|nr:zf-HC2 domain-containing protein [Bacillota bacterium]